MKKTATALTLCFALLVSAMIGVEVVRLAIANPYQGADNTSWRFFSPENHTTYNTGSLNFNFTCTTNDVWNEYYDHIDLEYIIDGPDYYDGSTYVMPYTEGRIFIEAPLTFQVLSGMGNVSRKVFEYSTQLTNLSDGQHNLTVYKEFNTWGPGTPFFSTEHETIIFYIKTASSTEDTYQFDFGVSRAYIQEKSCSLTYNITYLSELPSSNKTIIEAYSIELYSNNNLLGSVAWGFFPEGGQEISDLLWLTGYLPSASSGISSVNPNRTEVRTKSFQLLRELNPLEDYSANISLTVKRLGVLIVEGESIVNQLKNGEVIEHVGLKRYGDGFLYSELPVSSPTPSPEPTPMAETFPASLVFVVSIGIALAVIGLLVYLKRLKTRNHA